MVSDYTDLVARAQAAQAAVNDLGAGPPPTLFGGNDLSPTARAVLLQVDVPGKPRPQGSMTMWRTEDGETRSKYPPEVVAHRNLVVGQLADAWTGPRLDQALALRCRFVFARPASHYGTGRNRGRLKDSAPQHHTVYPDTDKLCRLVCDALTVAQVWRDDCLAVSVQGRKVWGETASTHIELLKASDAL